VKIVNSVTAGYDSLKRHMPIANSHSSSIVILHEAKIWFRFELSLPTTQFPGIEPDPLRRRNARLN